MVSSSFLAAPGGRHGGPGGNDGCGRVGRRGRRGALSLFGRLHWQNYSLLRGSWVVISGVISLLI